MTLQEYGRYGTGWDFGSFLLCFSSEFFLFIRKKEIPSAEGAALDQFALEIKNLRCFAVISDSS